jgi:hypothetical protein
VGVHQGGTRTTGLSGLEPEIMLPLSWTQDRGLGKMTKEMMKMTMK